MIILFQNILLLREFLTCNGFFELKRDLGLAFDAHFLHVPYLIRPSSSGQRTANFAATPDEPRGKFARAYNPPTLKNTTESKILPLRQNKLVI